MRLVAAHRPPLADSDGHAPSPSETRLRGNVNVWSHVGPRTRLHVVCTCVAQMRICNTNQISHVPRPARPSTSCNDMCRNSYTPDRNAAHEHTPSRRGARGPH
eukprot:4768154-Prymnesium_polylepis.1